MRLRAAVTATLFWCPSAFAAVASEAPPLVTVRDICPAKAACVVVDVDVTAKGDDATRIVGPSNSSCDGKVFQVRGRLRGSGVRTYRLALQGECAAHCADGRAAYFGRSGRNAPIIATDRGRFELVDPGVAVGAANDLIVIDEAKNTAAQYVGDFAGSDDYFVAHDRVYLRREQGACVAAPQNKPGMVGLASPQRCRAEASVAASAVAFNELSVGSRMFLDRLFAPQRLTHSAEDIVRGRMQRENGLIIIRPNDSCYAKAAAAATH